MSHPLLLLAEASGAAASGESAGAVTRIMNDFGIRAPLLLAQIVNFSIVAFLLWKFAFKPVMATVEDRRRKIDDGLKYANEMKARLEAAQKETAVQLREAQIKGQQIVAEAQKAAKEFADRQQKEATAKAGEFIVKAQAAIDLEKKKMLADARTEIARLVVATTERVLAKELSEADRSRFNASAAGELTKV